MRVGPIRYEGKCEARVKCGKRASIQLEGMNTAGHPIWRRDYCDAHAKSIIARAIKRGIRVFGGP
jgi:hypothetical protein